ncbi:polysaccharide pyruvyl transferase family protein [Actinokineospora sp. NBRC 105648]|uniref:polysaccharide pyruvyl transferase family protein n=1 Tax=Actinokineospora sp. NBRC 105648 TaxID=3032206 RepID=UPI0024A080D9|nr:polysaccharide pyruvyl transferase family protein [Actinokineospora sp. NBRC 105648]GLZ36698.1 polysaccharide pyruvyl transferase CsaB [Actinokineospora sp. NBRC 105648]
MTTRQRRIVFLGTHGQHNIGDELLLETFLTRLGTEHHYVVNSYDPAFTRTQLAGRFDVTVIDTAADRTRLLRALVGCDALCFGGGSIIKELNAGTGRNRYSTLLMILAIVTFTRRVARKPIAMLNVGVGPVRTPRGLRLSRMILSQVDELTVRDERSLALCRSIGVEPRPATDAVFSVDAKSLLGDGQDSSRTEQAASHGSPAPVRVALNLNFDVENPANWELFLSRLAQALESLDARHPIELHALPMQTGFKQHDDAEVLAGFAARVPSIAFVQHELSTPRDAARVIQKCDIVVSERLHAIVMASILGVPPFALVYDVKVGELAAMLRLAHWSVDINEPFDAAELTEKLAHLIRERASVAKQVAETSANLRREACDNFDRARRWIAGLGEPRPRRRAPAERSGGQR